MREKLEAHPLFERVGEEELDSDPAACLLVSATEEGQKVARNGGQVIRRQLFAVLSGTVLFEG